MKYLLVVVFCAILACGPVSGADAAENAGQTRQNLYDSAIKGNQTARELLISVSSGCVGYARHMTSSPMDLPEKDVDNAANMCVGTVAKTFGKDLETEFNKFNSNPELELLLYQIAVRSIFWGYEAKVNNQITDDASLMKCVTAVVNSATGEWLKF